MTANTGAHRLRSRRRYTPPPRPRFSRRFLIFLAGLVLLVLVPAAYREWRRSQPPPNVPLTVIARDAGRTPIAGVEVGFFAKDRAHLAACLVARTDADGRAVLPAEVAGGEFYCVGRRDDGTVSQSFVAQNGEHRTTLDFRPGVTIRGSVFDERGLPVAGARVAATLARGPALQIAQTGPDGHFRLPGVSGSLPFLAIRVRHEGHADATIEWDRGDDPNLFFRLIETQTLRVRVVAPGGEPVANTAIDVMGRSDLATKTDTDGYAEFTGVHPETRLFLRVQHPEFTFLNDGFRPSANGHVLRLEKPRKLEGRLLSFDSRGIYGAEVRHRHGPRAWVRTHTDRKGRFTIGDLPTGKVELHYELPTGEVGSTVANIDRAGPRDGLVIRVQ